jgi:hypothetical protein
MPHMPQQIAAINTLCNVMMRRPALAAAVVEELAPLLQQCASTATTAKTLSMQAVQTLASRATALCTSIAPGCKLAPGKVLYA